MTTLSDEPADREASVADLSVADILLELHGGDDVAETVDRVVENSRDALGCDGAGVLLIHARGRLETIASTGEDVTQAHLLQVELGEGPCLEATEDPRITYRVDDAVIDRQFPRWSAAVAQLGFRSILAIPLVTEKRRYGSLNFYARRPQAFSEDDEDVALILGRHASVAVAASHEIEGLRSAVDGRKVIGIAMGMLMERYDLESHTAFEVLRRYSQANNIKLRDVAEHVVAHRELPTAPN
jgi:GAF domain-containing protein